MKNFGKLALLGAALAVSATYAHATVISASDASAQPLANITAAALTSYETGATFVGSTSGALNGVIVSPPSSYTGNFTESVYKGESASQSPTGSACATCLAYVFTFNVTATTGGDGVSTWALANMFLGGLNSNNMYTVGSTTLEVVNTSGVTVQLGGIGSEGAGTSETIIDYTSTSFTQGGTVSSQDGMTATDPDLAPAYTPEPSSLMLLGTGLVSAAGMVMRRRRSVA